VALFGGTIEDWKEATLVIVDTLSEKFGKEGGSLIAEEGGVVDAILERVFTTLDGSTITIAHKALKDPVTITLAFKPQFRSQEK
jgi:hypothetical protein